MQGQASLTTVIPRVRPAAALEQIKTLGANFNECLGPAVHAGAAARVRLERMPAEELPDLPRFAAIDFETANSGRESACSVGNAVVQSGQVTELETRLIRPPPASSNSPTFTARLGTTCSTLHFLTRFGSEISPMLSTVEFLSAHNAAFDRGVLYSCCGHYGVARPSKPFVCTVNLARSEWGIFPTKLPDVCRRLRIPLDHHEAGSDAYACARIVLAALRKGWQWQRPMRTRAPKRRKPFMASRPRRFR